MCCLDNILCIKWSDSKTQNVVTLMGIVFIYAVCTQTAFSCDELCRLHGREIINLCLRFCIEFLPIYIISTNLHNFSPPSDWPAPRIYFFLTLMCYHVLYITFAVMCAPVVNWNEHVCLSELTCFCVSAVNTAAHAFSYLTRWRLVLTDGPLQSSYESKWNLASVQCTLHLFCQSFFSSVVLLVH